MTKTERLTWRSALWRLYGARRVTRAAFFVGHALSDFLGRDGACFPSQAALARAAGCCEKTVRTALAALRDIGLLTWVRRLVRVGWRTAQTSNAYVLMLPDGPLPCPPKPSFSRNQGSSALITAATDLAAAARAIWIPDSVRTAMLRASEARAHAAWVARKIVST